MYLDIADMKAKASRQKNWRKPSTPPGPIPRCERALLALGESIRAENGVVRAVELIERHAADFNVNTKNSRSRKMEGQCQPTVDVATRVL